MELGNIALGIHFENPELNKQFYQKALGKDRSILAARSHHPFAKKPNLSLVDIAQYPLVFTRLPGWNKHKYHLTNKLSNNSIEYKISFTSESLSLGLAAVENG